MEVSVEQLNRPQLVDDVKKSLTISLRSDELVFYTSLYGIGCEQTDADFLTVATFLTKNLTSH